MMQLTSHQQFYQHTSGLANELKAIENLVKGKEQQLLKGIYDLTQAVRNAAKVKRPPVVKEQVTRYFKELDQVLIAWQNKVANYDAGLSFREQFGDSMLVFVYGKVKAGKSSLGNFVASGLSEPDEAWMAQLGKQLHSPEFFLAEQNQKFAEAINFKQGFQVGGVETTSSIQGFRVPGMTWVDSPGLHSVNSENGELAQKYVDSADLIIYPMNSAQPGRQSDLKELEGLLKAGKRILVLITRCDKREEDVNEAGELVTTRIMKSAQDRQDQEVYTQQKLDELCVELGITEADTDVLTVSVGYAESQGNSPEAMQESGMQTLFDKLQGILKSEGIALKKQVPLNNLQHFYKLLLVAEGELSLANLQKPLNQALIELGELQGDLQQISEQAQSRIALALVNQVDQLVDDYAGQGSMDGLEEKLQALIENALAEHYQKPMQQLYQQAIGTFTSATTNMALSVDLAFEDKRTEITVDVSRKSAAIGTGFGAVLGGLAGLFFGPIGAAVGSTLGGMAGGAVGKTFNSQETRTLIVGDNREEIKNILLNKSRDQVAVIIKELNHKTSSELLLPLKTALGQVLEQTGVFENYLKEQSHV